MEGERLFLNAVVWLNDIFYLAAWYTKWKNMDWNQQKWGLCYRTISGLWSRAIEHTSSKVSSIQLHD